MHKIDSATLWLCIHNLKNRRKVLSPACLLDRFKLLLFLQFRIRSAQGEACFSHCSHSGRVHCHCPCGHPVKRNEFSFVRRRRRPHSKQAVRSNLTKHQPHQATHGGGEQRAAPPRVRRNVLSRLPHGVSLASSSVCASVFWWVCRNGKRFPQKNVFGAHRSTSLVKAFAAIGCKSPNTQRHLCCNFIQ